jgi:hypothetical protein
MSKPLIEAIYQHDLERAKATYDALVEAAEKQRNEKLAELEEELEKGALGDE